MNFPQQVADLQILGTLAFALAAIDAISDGGREFAVGGCIKFLTAQLCILQGENFGDGDTGRTAVHTVTACGAGNFVLSLIEGANLVDDFVLLLA